MRFIKVVSTTPEYFEKLKKDNKEVSRLKNCLRNEPHTKSTNSVRKRTVKVKLIAVK